MDTYARDHLLRHGFRLGLTLPPGQYFSCTFNSSQTDTTQHISIPLCLQFIAGLCMQLDFSVSLAPNTQSLDLIQEFKIFNTLLIDKNHRSPAAAQASSNIVRCTLAAIAVSFLQDMIDAMGIGWTFTLMGGLCLVAIGL